MGLVGSAVLRLLKKEGYVNILTETHKNLNLVDSISVKGWFSDNKPEYVICCAGTVGGIYANDTASGKFIYDNIMMATNTIHESYLNGVKKLIYLGSSCIYPKNSLQPIKEEYLLTGELEPTNKAYAIAKIAGIEMCKSYRKQYGCNFISAMPTNLYGVNDNYDSKNSHVIAALIKKFYHSDETVIIWGSGQPKREFLFSDDCADAILFLMNNYDEAEHINIGTGEDISISELAYIIGGVSKFKGKIVYDTKYPDGTLRKRLDVSKINKLGWKAKTNFIDGLEIAMQDYLKRHIVMPENMYPV